MHILFLPSWYPVSPHDIGGSFFREQALALHDAGCRVGVLSLIMQSLSRPRSALRRTHGLHFEDDQGVATFRKKTINWTPRMWGLAAQRFARQSHDMYQPYEARFGRPDVVHVHSTLLAGMGASVLREKYAIPFVVTEHSTAFARELVPPAGLAIARNICQAAEARFAVSTPFCRLLADKLVMQASDWQVMPNSVDRRFLDAPLIAPSGERFRFLHVSLLDRKKDVGSILIAFAERFGGCHGVELAIGGDGPLRAALTEQAKRLGVSEQIQFLGRLSRAQVREAMEHCNAFILSSKFETFGLVLVEALALGRPVIATRCGGPEEIVDEQSGLLVEADDVASLADAMDEMHRNPGRWKPEALRDNCRRRFGPHVVTQRLLSVYEEIASKREGIKL